MSKPMITQARLKELLSYDPETGLFFRIDAKRNKGKPFSNSGGYITIRLDERTYSASRLAWLYMTGAWPVQLVDHRNGVRDDNRWGNLREVTHSGNSQNQRHAQKPSRLLGAHFNRDRNNWTSCIRVLGVSKHLGTFPTQEAAHAAYIDAKRVHHATNTL